MTPIAHLLLEWYHRHARTLPWRCPPGAPLPVDPDWPYRVWLSEIMLQQTGVAVVQGYFAAFTARWPNVAALAAADDADVMQAWAGLGYYARARNLLACARLVVERHGGRFPGDEAALRDLPGIGDYTAAAIAAFGFSRHAIVIDGNVERVVSRLHAIETPLPAARVAIRARLETIVPATAAGDFAQGVMDLASRVCTPRNPECSACPVLAQCAGAATGNPARFPIKPPKRPRPLRRGTAWWIEAQGQVLTIIRPATGLLGGMRALPSCDWQGEIGLPPLGGGAETGLPPLAGGAEAELPPLAGGAETELPPLAGGWRNLGTVSHGFTHFELALTVMGLRLSHPPALAGDWIAIAQLDGAGLPTLFEKAANLARARMDETA